MFRSYLKKDLGILIIITIFATLITYIFRINLFLSTILFFGIPSIFLALKEPSILKKSFVFAFLLSFPLSLFVDTLASINSSWVVPVSIFPFRFFNAGTVEIYIYGLLWVLYAVLFYEHFFDKHTKKDKTSPHIKYLVFISVIFVLYTFFAFFFNQSLLYIPYFYLFCGVLLVIIPLALFLLFYPAFIRKYVILTVYFFFVMFLFEVVAVYIGQWIFPAKDFIGLINFFGVTFPVEELIIWITLATASLISYYEFFDDDLL